MPAREYLDFELNVEALPDGKIRITVAESPVGSPTVESTNPFTADEIARMVGILGGAIQASRGEAARAARNFGERLFNAVFTGQVYAAYVASRAQAGESGLRIRLTLDQAGPLGDLPWELLRDPAGDYLALSRQTPVMRYPRLLTTRPIVEVTLPLRVLVLISSPKDQETLDVEGEWNELQAATADLRQRGLLELTRLDNAQLVTLQRKLREGTSYQIFHYIGHAAFDERSQTGMLAFEDPRTENTVPVSGEGLARELVEENSIRLVVLNACQSARDNPMDPCSGVGSSIIARGVPAIVAMQFSISDDASRVFSAEFYRAICEGYPVEAAMAEARRAISNSLGNQEWATPVLYLRSQDGVLFPKRRATETPASRGGLREAILRPPVLIGLLLAGIIGVALLMAVLNGINNNPATPPPVVSTLTPTPDTGPRDIDLTVTRVRFLPPRPAPGQNVTVTLTLKNNGRTSTGPFQWAWFATESSIDESIPSQQGTVPDLGPGLETTVRGEYRFGWWTTELTTAWVNFDNAVPETNVFNNIKRQSLRLSDTDPFVIDFSVLPDGKVLEPGDLRGDTFAPWQIQLGPMGEDECSAAVAKVVFDEREGINQLVTGLPVVPNAPTPPPTQCAALPLAFAVGQPEGGPPVNVASLQFVASVAGRYTLELREAGGALVTSQSVDVAAPGTQSLTLPRQAVPISGRRIILIVPDNAQTIVRRLSLSLGQ